MFFNVVWIPGRFLGIFAEDSDDNELSGSDRTEKFQ